LGRSADAAGRGGGLRGGADVPHGGELFEGQNQFVIREILGGDGRVQGNKSFGRRFEQGPPRMLTRTVPSAVWPVTATLPATRVGCRPGATETTIRCPVWPGRADTEARLAGAVAGLLWEAATLSVGAAGEAAAATLAAR